MKLLHILIFSLISSLTFAQNPGGVSANLQLWLKADVGTTVEVGGELSKWDDQSGNSKHAEQATAINRPIYTQIGNNFNPAIDFDGAISSNYLTAPSIFGISTISDANIFIVCMLEKSQTNVIFDEDTQEGRYASHLPWNLTNSVYYDAGDVSTAHNRLITPWGASEHIPYIWSMLSSSTGTDLGNNQNILRNSTEIASDDTYRSFKGINSNFNLGANISATEPYNGKISEVILYTGVLSSSDRSQIESYLAIKYGITKAGDYLASDGTTVIWNSTTNAAYHHDVTVIGRDDDSGLHQRQSLSQAPNAMITVVSVDGASAIIDFSFDKEFFALGNDNGALSGAGISDFPPTINNRIARVWKAIETGTPGIVKLKLDVSEVEGPSGIATTDLANVRLLVDDDGIFSDATVIAPELTAYDNTANTIEFDYDFLVAGAYYISIGSTDANAFVASKAPGGVIDGLQYWVKADLGISPTTNGTKISQWDDQSGRDKHGTQGTVGDQPLYRSLSTNFNPGVDFDGNDKFVSTSLIRDKLIGHPSVYIVSTQEASSNNFIIREMTNDSRFSAHLPRSDNKIYWDAGSTSSLQRQEVSWGGSDNIPYLWSLQASIDATPNGDLQNISRNGQVLISDENYSAFIGNSSAFEIGQAYKGHINEVLIYTEQHTAIQEKQIESYLAIKYGLTKEGDYLDSDGNMLWNATDNADFHYDIIGIGRDDFSELNQKQSESENSSAILTIGLVDIFVDNNTNTNTFSSDQDIIIVGSNGISSNEGSDDAGTTINAENILVRLNRTWKASETGSVGTLKLRLDMSQSIGPSGPGTNDLANVRLLVDADGVFASSATSIAPSIYNNSTDIVEFDYDLNGTTGYYFSIGSVNIISTPLPIELVDFTADVQQDRSVRLKWQTASETNNDFFTIERSRDGTNWQQLYTIEGAGNSSLMLSYAAVDRFPFTGHSYYRLKQTDYDGQFSYSMIRVVQIEDFQSNELMAFPNPASDEVTLILDPSEWKSLKIYTATTGTDLSDLIKKTNHKGQLHLDLSLIKSGAYFLRSQYKQGQLIVIK